MRGKMIMLNLRPEDRISQTDTDDGQNNHSNCDFALTKPLQMKSNGTFYLRSAYLPITYKNIVKGRNDRFIIRFKGTPTKSDDDSVFVVIQIPSGQYDTLSALATAIDLELGGLASGLNGVDFNRNGLGGGSCNVYGSDATEQKRAILNGNMSCAVSSDAQSKNHLVFTIDDNVKYASTSIMTKDGGTVGSQDLNDFSIMFKDFGDGGASGNTAPVATVLNRTAHKQMGFSNDRVFDGVGRFSANDGDTIVNGGASIAVSRTSLSSTPDAIFYRSQTTGSVIFTPYIYVRCDLTRDSIETKNRGSKQTDLIAKIPVTSSGYGDANFYEADNLPMRFNLPDGTIQNFSIKLTDDEAKELPLEGGDWSMCLVFEGMID